MEQKSCFSILILFICVDSFFCVCAAQRKKFVDESKSLMEQILKLEELLSSRKNILQVTSC